MIFASAILKASALAPQAAILCAESVPLFCGNTHARTDAQTKMKTGALPDGRVYLLGSQVSNTTTRHKRDPLTLSVSSDGLAFDRAWALRSNASEYRYPLPSVQESGKVYGFSYPDAVIFNGSFWASYATNKEDIEVLEVPLASLRGHVA